MQGQKETYCIATLFLSKAKELRKAIRCNGVLILDSRHLPRTLSTYTDKKTVEFRPVSISRIEILYENKNFIQYLTNYISGAKPDNAGRGQARYNDFVFLTKLRGRAQRRIQN